MNKGGFGLPFFVNGLCLIHCVPMLISFPNGVQDMRLSFGQVETIRLEAEHRFGVQGWTGRLGLRVDDNQRGFTLVELVMTLVIVGIISAVAIPRFFDTNVFQSSGFADQVQASLRYAQKVAIAQRRFVCVTIAGNSLSLATGATAACGTQLPSLSGGGNYVINAPSGVTVTDASFNFNALGSSSAGVTVGVAGDITRNIIVETGTGYVHQ